MSVRPKGALGIKTADGAIVAVLDFSSQRWNQTVFTTVGDRQNKALFDFYYRAEATGGWVYLDSLPLSHIPPAPAGGPELSVRTQVDARGNLSLRIHDPAASKPFSFVLKAETLGRIGQELETGRAPAETGPGSQAGAAAGAEACAPDLRSPAAERGQQRVVKSRRRWLLVLAPVAVLLVAAILLRRRDTPMPETRSSIETPPAEMQAGVADTSAAQAIGPEEADRERSVGEVGTIVETPHEDQNVAHLPDIETGDKGEYSITWGDTLWRITERFYGNRDLYPALADANRLPDPDVIVAGRTLLLPPLLQEERASSSDESRTSR
jgi:nucleoid-associated protein YgaU